MNWQAFATLTIIVAAMALFASERLRVDLTALLALLITEVGLQRALDESVCLPLVVAVLNVRYGH
jgi:hypothetical protein